MGKLTGAATESERTDTADCAGMAIRHGMRRTRQHDTEFGSHDMRNALLGIVDVEQADAEFAAALTHRPDEGSAARIGFVIAARLGRNGMILDREGQIGTRHAASLLAQLREGVMGMQFMQNVTVDIKQVTSVGALADAMKVPDFIE